MMTRSLLSPNFTLKPSPRYSDHSFIAKFLEFQYPFVSPLVSKCVFPRSNGPVSYVLGKVLGEVEDGSF